MLLTHYFHASKQPFKILSALPDDEAVALMSNLKNKSGKVYRRFDNPQQYLHQRRETESWLRREFIQKGGKPESDYPHYFVLGKSVWIEAGFLGAAKSIQIEVSNLNSDCISFTYPDSMVSHWLSTQRDKIYYHSEYHGQIFTVNEILKVVDRFGIPQVEWKTDRTRKYDFFIEAQAWVETQDLLSFFSD